MIFSSGKWCPCTATLSGSLARMAIFNRKATEFAFHDESSSLIRMMTFWMTIDDHKDVFNTFQKRPRRRKPDPTTRREVIPHMIWKKVEETKSLRSFWVLQRKTNFPLFYEGFEKVDTFWGQNETTHEINS